MLNQIIQGDCREVLKTLPDNSVNCCVTSPPYFGLRDYGASGQIGLEETPAEYVAALVEVFREVKRVLTKDGTCWVNLGDSYASGKAGRTDYGTGDKTSTLGPKRDGLPNNTRPGEVIPRVVSSNIADCLNSLVKSQPMFFRDSVTIGITSQSVNVPLNDNGFPYGELFSLFGIERVTVKQRDNDFCQVFNIFNNNCYCRISSPMSFMQRDATSIEIVLDAGYSANIVISEHKPNISPIFGIPGVGSTGSGKKGNCTLAIKETAKPITETIWDGQTIGDAFTFDTPLKRFPDIYFVNNAVSFADRLNPSTSQVSNFTITKASLEQFNFSLGGRVQLSVNAISHIYFLNSFGSLVHYTELYDKAKRIANTQQPKQELGIPEMVKRGLMEDGWICRSTIIWHKPNPMPESVTDRPTKSHEYIFLFTKAERYFYDADAVKEPAVRPNETQNFSKTKYENEVIDIGDPRYRGGHEQWGREHTTGEYRNKRTVWTVATQPYTGSHFATFPEKLIEPCILAGCPAGGTVLDPFGGSGTTGRVATKLGRNSILIELNPNYLSLIEERTDKVQIKMAM